MITQDGFMGWPCKEAQSGSMVTIYRCMGLPTMYNSVSSGAILALRHFRYSRIWSADNINYAQFSSFVSQQHAWMKVHWMVVSSSWRRRWWIFVGVLRNSSFNLKKLLLCMTRIKRCIFGAVYGERWWRKIGTCDGGEASTLMVDTGQVCERNVTRVA